MRKQLVPYFFGFIGIALWLCLSFPLSAGIEGVRQRGPGKKRLAQDWQKFSGGRRGKVIYSRAPHMYILYLHTGELKQVPGVTTAGAAGRRRRGASPRPFWSTGGQRFVYRFNGNVFVCDEKGKRKPISNERMDCGDETRWSWWRDKKGKDWLVGPSKKNNVILVNPENPAEVKTAYPGEDVDLHCEMTGDGYLVFDDGPDIYALKAFGPGKPIKISYGQSCRPCAAPDGRVAWLTVPHVKYLLHNAQNGKLIQEIPAPPGEELYRLNWSNHPDFAAHMFGSRGDDRMNVRKISTGQALFIGWGWDPDVFVED